MSTGQDLVKHEDPGHALPAVTSNKFRVRVVPS
jgi:hypothetical protein